jgi:predicted RND superfamily exporter protein
MRAVNEERPALVVRHRRLSLAILFSVASLFALAIPRLQMRLAPEELVAPDDDAARAEEAMREAFGPEEEVLLVLVEALNVLAPEVLDWSHGVARALGRLDGVRRVESLGTTPLPRQTRDERITLEGLDAENAEEAERRVRAEAAVADVIASDPARFPRGMLSLAEGGRGAIEIAPLIRGERATAEERAAIEEVVRTSPLVRGRLISESRRVLAIAATLAPDTSEEAAGEIVEQALAIVDSTPAPAEVRVRLAGLPAMRVMMMQTLRADQAVLISLAALGSFLVLALGMRSRAGVLLPMGAVVIALAIAVGGMALAGEPINLLTHIIPPLLIAIGLSDAVHMVLRYRDELRMSAGDRTAAASRMLRAMWRPCLVTSLTTAIGFGALVTQEIEVLRRFGVTAACATLVSYVVTVMFVPASLPYFRSAGEAPSRSARFALRGLDRVVVTAAQAGLRRPWAIIGVCLLVLVASLVLSRGVVADSTLLDQFDRDSEIAVATRLVERELDGLRTLSVGLSAEEGRFFSPRGIEDIERLAQWLSQQPGVLRVTTYADWLREAWAWVTADPRARSEPLGPEARIRALRALVASGGVDPLTRYVTSDGAQARIEVRLEDQGASRILAMLARFEERAARIPGIEVYFAGEAWNASRGLARIVESLGSLVSAVLLMFGVMMLLFRSAKLGLLSVLPNALPLAMTLAYMAVRSIPLHAATVIVFTVSIGLAVDGAIHVIARFREELERGGPIRDTVIRTMATSGRGIVLSSLTLLLGYGALLVSAFQPVRLFGELSAIAIGGSLIAHLVLLPALLAVGVRPTAPDVSDERA